MKIYLGIKYDPSIFPVITGIRTVLSNLGHEPYCFVLEGQFQTEKDMMEKALKAIDESDLILLECSSLAFGVGIEGGYAYARNKKIISIASSDVTISRTIKGISMNTLQYKDFKDLEVQLRKIL